MSNETLEKEDQELEELRQQIEQKAEAEKEQAAKPEETAEPSPAPAPSEPIEAAKEEPASVTPNPSNSAKPSEDDPMEWAKKKGLKTPEDMARLLRQKEQEFHQSRQQKSAQDAPPVPPQPNWNPTPQMGYGYPPPPAYGYPQPPRLNPRELAPYYPQLAPEDVERVMPLVMDAAEVISNRKLAQLRQEFGAQVNDIQRTTARNNELMQLMQDPAFHDPRVQKEIHAVLDSDPSIFQRERAPIAAAFKEAVYNLGRKQLQQGAESGKDPIGGNRPPVTAGGGNGSASTAPIQITEKIFNSWSVDDQKAFINSNGRTLPKGYRT